MAVDAPEPTPFNPYATPKAVVGELPTEPNSQPTFFPVGRMKLALMSIVTFGLYLVYWSYQNWKSVERLNNEELGAPLRAFFYPLTSYYLFQRIEGHVVPMQIKIAIQPGVLALGVVILAVSWRLPDPYWLVTFLGFFPFLPIQSAVNELNRKVAPAAEANNRFSGWNIFGLVVGGTLFVAAIVGVFIGDA